MGHSIEWHRNYLDELKAEYEQCLETFGRLRHQIDQLGDGIMFYDFQIARAQRDGIVEFSRNEFLQELWK